MMRADELKVGDILVEDDKAHPNVELLVLAIGAPKRYESTPGYENTLGVMYTFLDEAPFQVYGPWLLNKETIVQWSRKE